MQDKKISSNTATAENTLGAKRLCAECAARFYDLGQNPAPCPKCGALFELVQNNNAANNAEDSANDNKSATDSSEDKSDSDDLSLEEMIEAESNDDDESDDTLLPENDSDDNFSPVDSVARGGKTGDEDEAFASDNFLNTASGDEDDENNDDEDDLGDED